MMLMQSWALARLRIAGEIKQYKFGVFWILIEPLLYFVALLLLHGHIVYIKAIPYVLFVALGLMFFSVVRRSIVGSARIFHGHNLNILEIGLPKSVVSMAYFMEIVLRSIPDIVLVLIICFIFKNSFIGFVLLLFIYLAFLVFSYLMMLFFAIFGEKFRDIEKILIFSMQGLILMSPVFIVPVNGSVLHTIQNINPVTWFMVLGREFLYLDFDNLVTIVKAMLTFLLSMVVINYIHKKFDNDFVSIESISRPVFHRLFVRHASLENNMYFIGSIINIESFNKDEFLDIWNKSAEDLTNEQWSNGLNVIYDRLFSGR